MQIDYDLPSVTLPEVPDVAKLWAKYVEECGEYRRETDPFCKVVELWDVLQVVATMLANGGGAMVVEAHFCARRMMAKYPLDISLAARQSMLLKNATRPRPGGGTGYYSPLVCQRIIETGGAEWRIDNADN